MIADISAFVKDCISQNFKKAQFDFYIIYHTYYHNSTSINIKDGSTLSTFLKLAHEVTTFNFQLREYPFDKNFQVKYDTPVKIKNDQCIELSNFLDNINDLNITHSFLTAFSDYITNCYIHYCTNTLITPSNCQSYDYQYDSDSNIICPAFSMFTHTAAMLSGAYTPLYYYGFNSLRRTPIDYLYIDYKMYFDLLDKNFKDIVLKIFKEM